MLGHIVGVAAFHEAGPAEACGFGLQEAEQRFLTVIAAIRPVVAKSRYGQWIEIDDAQVQAGPTGRVFSGGHFAWRVKDRPDRDGRDPSRQGLSGRIGQQSAVHAAGKGDDRRVHGCQAS